MKNIYLNFPVFFNCVIKKNTTLANFNAVSILLVGHIRPNSTDPHFFSNATVSQYVSGSVKIRAPIIDPLQSISQAEAVARVKQLGFQNYELAAKDCIALLLHAKGLALSVRSYLFSMLNDQTHSVKERCYEFIAAVFIQAIHYNQKDLIPLTNADKKELAGLEIPTETISEISEFINTDLPFLQDLLPHPKITIDPMLKLMDEPLWQILQEKVRNSADAHRYLASIEHVINYALERTSFIQDNFPMFTQHNETHIITILRLMANLLGNRIDDLSHHEIAILILSAYCHDIGLGFKNEERDDILGDRDRLDRYLDLHKEEYVKAYCDSSDIPTMSDEMMRDYLCYIQHERIAELLYQLEWPSTLETYGLKEDVIQVCQAHRINGLSSDILSNRTGKDLRLCAILLHIADIMAFDTSRAPQIIYDCCGFGKDVETAPIITKSQWQEYQISQYFDFENVSDRSYPYSLDYHGRSKSMQIEQTLNHYFDWLNQELFTSATILTQFAGKWQNFALPAKINRLIVADGYISGQYRFTLDQDRVLKLLIGEELYTDPSVFVRELLQNAIDAVRTRPQLDKDLPKSWKPQINIRTWIDHEGYHWFRIEDNGIGMTEEIIQKFFLKVGSSYYNSDEFRQEKLRCRADPNYMPISRFGIGILSCFMGTTKINQVEVSTKRFSEDGNYHSALRLSMQGMNGYYYMASKLLHHSPGPMKGKTSHEQKPYMESAGTAIAVRTNLYQSGVYTGFKEVLDKYIVYPSVPIHYEGDEGSFDYMTEQEVMDTIYRVSPFIEFTIPKEKVKKINETLNGNIYWVPPTLKIKCLPLNTYTNSPNITGAILGIDFSKTSYEADARFGNYYSSCTITTRFEQTGAYGNIDADIMVHFPPNFTDSLSGKVLKYEEYEAMSDKQILYGNMVRKYGSCELEKTIASLLIFTESQYNGWESDVTNKYDITMDKFIQTCEAVALEIQEASDLFIAEKEEMDAVLKFRDADRGWQFKILNFTDIDWYNKYFLNMEKNTGLSNIVAHNGILCGDGSFFCTPVENSYVLGMVMLLKDKYRPDLYVARNGIQDIPLELACDLSSTQAALKEKESIVLDSIKPIFSKTNFSYIPERVYQDLLDLRPDIKDQLQICSEGVSYKIDELYSLLEESDYIVLDGHILLYGLRNMDTLYKCLCIACLKQKFSLYISYVSDQGYFNNKIYISKKAEQRVHSSCSDIYSAQFFLQPLDSDCPYLTNEYAHTRYACNARHRISKFMIENGSLLQKRAPGILSGLIHTLAEDNVDTLINNVNSLLGRLRKLRDFQTEVPISLELTRSDLY